MKTSMSESVTALDRRSKSLLLLLLLLLLPAIRIVPFLTLFPVVCANLSSRCDTASHL